MVDCRDKAKRHCGLFVVATPIGNLEDITYRAVEVLREADVIAAEDTRHSRRLLTRYGIDTPLVSYHEHNEAARCALLLKHLSEGRNVALITDAGTPCISDPGYRIVRAAHEHGVRVIPVPGPSASVAALSASGMPADRVTFHAFFPRKRSAAADVLAFCSRVGGTHVFFESPKRLQATLKICREQVLHAEVCVARELTKLHEEVVLGTPEALLRRFDDAGVRGECVLLIHAPETKAETPEHTPGQLRDMVERIVEQEGLSRRDAVRRIADQLSLPRRKVYQATVKER